LTSSVRCGTFGEKSGVVVGAFLGKEAAAEVEAEIADERHSQTVVLEIGVAAGQRVVPRSRLP